MSRHEETENKFDGTKISQERTTVNSTVGPAVSANSAREVTLASFVSTKKREFEMQTQDLRSKWSEYYDNYRQRLPSTHKWRSTIFDPSTFQQVESLTPRIYGALFPSDEWFDVEATNVANIEGESSVKALTEDNIRKAEFETLMVDVLKQALIYGFTAVKIHFSEEWQMRHDKKVSFRPENIDILGLKRMVADEVTVEPSKERVFYGPRMELVDVYDLYADPLDTELSECVHVVKKHIDDMKELQREGVYHNVDKIKSGGDRRRDDETDTGDERFLHGSRSDSGNFVTLSEYWGMYDLDGDGEVEPVVITVANEKTVVRAEPNPFWHGRPPFAFSSFISVPKELYGIGIAEAIASLQKQINETINQRMDNVSLILNRMWVVSSLIDIDLKRLQSVPGRIILASDVEGVKPLETPDVTASAYNEVSVLKGMVEQATGFTRFAAGLEQGKTTPRAARTVLAFQQASLDKFGMTIRYLEKKLVVPILSMFLQLNQQYLDDMEYLRITKEGKPEMMIVDPNELRGSYKFTAKGASELVNKEQQIQAILTMLSIAANDETLDRLDLYNKLWELLGMREKLKRNQQPEQGPGGEANGNQSGQMLTSGGINPAGVLPVPGGGI